MGMLCKLHKQINHCSLDQIMKLFKMHDISENSIPESWYNKVKIFMRKIMAAYNCKQHLSLLKVSLTPTYIKFNDSEIIALDLSD